MAAPQPHSAVYNESLVLVLFRYQNLNPLVWPRSITKLTPLFSGLNRVFMEVQVSSAAKNNSNLLASMSIVVEVIRGHIRVRGSFWGGGYNRETSTLKHWGRVQGVIEG